MASLVDTNVLIYRFDARYPIKQGIAYDLLKQRMRDDSLVIAHQSLVEFVAAVSRPHRDLGNQPILTFDQARVEAEELMAEFRVVYPDRDVFMTALRGASMYGLSWFDAHLWAYAEVHGLAEIYSEDFEHGRHFGDVRVVDPFLVAGDAAHALPPLYAQDAVGGDR